MLFLSNGFLFVTHDSLLPHGGGCFCSEELDHSSIASCWKDPHVWEASRSESHFLPSQWVPSVIPNWEVGISSPKESNFRTWVNQGEMEGWTGDHSGTWLPSWSWFSQGSKVLSLPALCRVPLALWAPRPHSPLSLYLKGQGSWENPAKWELKMMKQLIRSEMTRMRNKSH